IGWFGQAMKVINKPLDATGDLIIDSPGVGHALKKAIEGLTSVCNDAAQWSVRPEAIFQEFKDAGHHNIQNHSDLVNLDLEEIDKVVGWLGAKYKGIALVEGAGAGAIGAPGLIADIPT